MSHYIILDFILNILHVRLLFFKLVVFVLCYYLDNRVVQI